MPMNPPAKPLSPALEKRRIVERTFSSFGKIILIFLGGALAVLLAAYGRELYDILTKGI